MSPASSMFNTATDASIVAVLNMDDAGDIAPAAAMALMIVYTSAFFRVLHALFARFINSRTQVWRTR